LDRLSEVQVLNRGAETRSANRRSLGAARQQRSSQQGGGSTDSEKEFAH